MHICIHIISTYVRLYACIYSHTYVQACVCVCVLIQTHTQTNARMRASNFREKFDGRCSGRVPRAAKPKVALVVVRRRTPAKARAARDREAGYQGGADALAPVSAREGAPCAGGGEAVRVFMRCVSMGLCTVYTHKNTCVHAYIDTYMHACILVHTCIHISMHACMQTCRYA